MFDYDDRDSRSILRYARKFKDKTFNDIMSDYEASKKKLYHNPNIYDVSLNELEVQEEEVTYYISDKAKGQIGNILERCGFGYKPNGKQEADFPKAKVELKLTPIDINKKGQYVAGERLSITNISFKDPVIHDFMKSHVWEKIQLILLVQYLRDKTIDRLDNEIKFVNLFTPPEKDLKIIMNDYKKIISKIEEGKANELSEADTMYLGACTKGATAEKSMQPQSYYNSLVSAKKRNFCLKLKYMSYVLNEYVLKEAVPYKLPSENFYRYNDDIPYSASNEVEISTNGYESIIENASILETMTFEEYVIKKISRYIGYSCIELCNLFDCNDKLKSKSLYSILTFRMLGIKSNKAEEFVKAGIVVKAIRLEENKKIKESMSLPSFWFKQLIEEEWEESALYRYLSETKFLLVVFAKINGVYALDSVRFWNMPMNTVNTVVYQGWLDTKKIVNEGVQFTLKNGKMYNNLLNKTDNEVIHVRPHIPSVAYKLHNGYEIGDVTKHGDQLPNGEWMTRQSFWINNTYIAQILGY